jgi:hypothetical protein
MAGGASWYAGEGWVEVALTGSVVVETEFEFVVGGGCGVFGGAAAAAAVVVAAAAAAASASLRLA